MAGVEAGWTDVIRLAAVFFLVLANGFFVAAEFSLVAVRRSRVAELVASGQRNAAALQKAIDHLDGNLAATQLGITISSLALGWIGEPALAHLIEPLLAFLPVAEQQTVLDEASDVVGDPPRPARSVIETDIDQVRRRGYAVSDGDVTPGIAALGAPVFNHRGDLVAAISVSGLRAQVLGDQERRNIELIRAGAQAVSKALGQEDGS